MASPTQYYLFESAVGNLIRAAGFELLPAIAEAVGTDFVFIDRDEKSAAVEVRVSLRTPDFLGRLEQLVVDLAGKVDRFFLVTPAAPPVSMQTRINSVFANAPLPCELFTGQAFFEHLGFFGAFDLADTKAIEELNYVAFVNHLGAQEKKALQTQPISPGTNIDEYLKSMMSSKSDHDVGHLQSLSRQLPIKILAEIKKRPEGKSIEEMLGVGESTRGAVVLLADLVNFSSLVKAASPYDLQEVMSSYYRKVRESVWLHDGVLDKFIGDATLAIFGYPSGNDQAPLRALSFAKELIKIGANALGELTSRINEVFPLGTRIGIASGDLWALDIGSGVIELSFVGDVINLAARLEKNCEVDGILIDNKTKVRADRQGPDAFASDVLEMKTIDPADAKGQVAPIRAWQVKPAK